MPGGSVECTVTSSDDLVAARLAADLRGAEQVDLVKCDAEGREENRLKDITVSASAQEVVLLERIDRVRALPACVQRVRHAAVARVTIGLRRGQSLRGGHSDDDATLPESRLPQHPGIRPRCGAG